ncbi:replication/maintenance protein RepL [Streptomyces sp. 3211.6]|uniref:replication/maintenance protein RepL n=1 Tax=Streptomyces sp. 3211.6 TaxID=1938845 RepID=UPI0011E5B963|nr:replication/maintenance protein RepL [Streptomyces sp. 3211.6]
MATSSSARTRAARTRVQVAEAVASLIQPGESADITIRRRGPYTMLVTTDAAMTGDDSGPIHVVVSLDFLRHLPDYNVGSLAKDTFWKIVGALAEVDENGRYLHMNENGEVAIKQDELAAALGVSRRSVNTAVGQLMERSFIWKSGRGRYQIHPYILYFGTSTAQARAIGYAEAKRKDGKLPPIPRPGAVIARQISEDGVTDVIA